jgi:hypothetical protein
MLHAILNKGNLVGIFSDYQKCKVMFEGLVSNNFVIRKNLEIKSYYENSITVGEYDEEIENLDINTVSEVLEEFTDNNTTDTENEKNNIKKEEEIKKKHEIQNKIYELKKQKEKIEESKNVYNVDFDLYKKFKKIKETSNNFEIPEMFIDKYELMEGLEKENKLCWENYYELYKPKNISTNYDKLFN